MSHLNFSIAYFSAEAHNTNFANSAWNFPDFHGPSDEVSKNVHATVYQDFEAYAKSGNREKYCCRSRKDHDLFICRLCYCSNWKFLGTDLDSQDYKTQFNEFVVTGASNSIPTIHHDLLNIYYYKIGPLGLYWGGHLGVQTGQPRVPKNFQAISCLCFVKNPLAIFLPFLPVQTSFSVV